MPPFKALCEYTPDVVHIHLDTLYAPLWALFHKKKVIFTVHSQAHRAFSSKFYIMLHRYLALHRDYTITAVSDIIAKETEQLFNISDMVRVVYNPVEIQMYERNTESEVVNYVNVARFHKVKNHRLLIEAFAKSIREFSNMKLWLAGDGPLYEESKMYVERMGLSNNIIFLGNVEDIGGLLTGQKQSNKRLL